MFFGDLIVKANNVLDDSRWSASLFINLEGISSAESKPVIVVLTFAHQEPAEPGMDPWTANFS